MNIIIVSIFVFAISVVILSFFSLKLSVALYMSYWILVPYMQFHIMGMSLSYNLVNTLLLFVFLYQLKIKKTIDLDYKVITPFLFLYLSLFILSLFAQDTPWGVQINYWRASFMQTCILSFIIWNLSINDTKTLTYFKWALIISITIACIYGVFLIKLGGINPYTTLVTHYFNLNDFAFDYSSGESRLSFSSAEKIQSTMLHPMTWTLLLCFLFIVFVVLYLKTTQYLYLILLGLISFNILISGVRTGIAALAIGFFYYFIRYRNFKVIGWGIALILILALVVQSNDDLMNLFASFVDISGTKSSVQGSSIALRLEQLQGTLNEINTHFLVGKGYGWNNYYLSTHLTHPVILAFESLVFVVLCNSGILGACVWITFIWLLYRLHRSILKAKDDYYLMDVLVLVYIAYAIGTGEYGYIQFFAIYHSFLLAYLFNNQTKKEKLAREIVVKILLAK